MQAARTAKTSDKLGRYYTDTAIAALLVAAMPDCRPEVVLDLGAGAGSLTLAAAAAWPSARFLTVDFDISAASAQLVHEHGALFRHIQGDALSADLPALLDLLPGSVDAAVCNPPYLRPRWEPHYASILAAVGLGELGVKLNEVPADLLFLAQNLRLLKEGGLLGLIIPDGVIAGERFVAVRAAILRHHRVERIIELPRRVFKNTDAKAHILVLKKGAADGAPVPVHRVQDSGQLSSAISLTVAQAAARMDFSFYAAGTTAGGASLSDLGATVWRGRITSASRAQFAFRTFHTSDFTGAGEPAATCFQLSPENAKQAPGTPAMAGDILLARIGRTLERKVCQVVDGPVAVSDSVLVLRLPVTHRERVLRFLSSDAGQSMLGALAHGVAARFITARSLLALRVPLL